MAEGETQYNIPVSSKQLIVYFVFLVIALSAAFLAGVMVGRNVDALPEPIARDIEDKIPEEAAASPTPDSLTYGATLQTDKIEGLATKPTPGVPPGVVVTTPKAAPAVATTPKPAAAPRPSPASSSATPAPAAKESRPPTAPPSPGTKPTAKPVVKPTPHPAEKPASKPASVEAKPRPGKSPAATPVARLTIQVGAFKERAAAEAIVKRLKGKGYSAYLVPVSDGLFNVRVGSFTDREDAERILAKLETQEKFKPFIVKP